MKTRLFLAALAIGTLIVPAGRGAAQDFPYQVFERYVEPLAQQIGMPGLSAIIIRNNRVEWRRGYGYADAESRTPATTDTPFAIGGVMQAITGVMVGICVDRHQLGVNEGIRTYVPTFPTDASIRQVLSHSSTGRFAYDPAAFSTLTSVVERCTGRSFREATAAEIITRLSMTRAAPGLDLREGSAPTLVFDRPDAQRFLDNVRLTASPYRIRNGQYSRSEHPQYGFDAAGGMVASAEDLARFEGSLDDTPNDTDNIPISRSTLMQLWSQQSVDIVVNVNGRSEIQSVPVPTGLGWFVQITSGVKLVWTFGHIPDAGSALIVKMPEKRLTLIMLSNSGGLAAGNSFEQGDVTTSPFVKVFLRLFI
jgi:CubicO group peptidase (beta-lactamase class C family)